MAAARSGRSYQGGAAGDADEVWVLDTHTGRTLDRASLGGATTGSAMLAHPDRRHLGVDLAIPYGGWIGWGHWADGRAVVVGRETPYEVLTDTHPGGDRYLTAPIEAEAITVRRFSDGLVEVGFVGEFGQCLSISADSSRF